MYIATKDDFQLLKQSVKNIYSKVELLNENFTIIDEIHGYVTAGSISINADSDIRRTCSLSMVLANKSVLRGAEKIIWLTKYVRVHIGFENIRTKKIQYYNQGVFAFVDNSFSYSAQDCSVSLTCQDMMCKWNGILDGQLIGSAFRVPALKYEVEVPEVDDDSTEGSTTPPSSGGSAGSSKPKHDRDCVLYGKVFFGEAPSCTCRTSRVSTVSTCALEDETMTIDETVSDEPDYNIVFDVMKSVVTQLGHVDRYDLEIMKDGAGNVAKLPYDLDFETGTTVYSIFKELSDLYDGYEFFFDTDGTFVFQAIPTLEDDECVLTADELEELVVSEQLSGSFSNVRNATEVWGICHEEDHYSETSTLSGSTYSASVTGLQLTDDGKIQSGEKFAVMINEANPKNPSLKINNLDAFPICDDGKEDSSERFAANQLQPGSAYVFRFRKGYFIFLGEWQVHATCMLYNEYPWIRQARLEVDEMVASKELAPTEIENKLVELSEQYKHQVFENDKKRWNCDYIKYRLVPDNPFAIDALNGQVLMQVKTGGDFSSIYSDDLAAERAEYECLIAARYNDTLTLEMHVVPWLEVNQKIEYRVKHSNEVSQWIVKSISFDLTGGTMNVTCIRFYRLFPAETQDETTRGLKPANE